MTIDALTKQLNETKRQLSQATEAAEALANTIESVEERMAPDS